MIYTVMIEKGKTNWGAFVPDLPGCVAAGETKEEVLELIKEAMQLHIYAMLEDGEEIPVPSESVLVAV